MENINNYKGSTSEKDTLLLVGNIACAVDHLYEASMVENDIVLADKYYNQAVALDKLRMTIMRRLKDVPENLWCVYKHLAIARVMTGEMAKLDNKITTDDIYEVNESIITLFGEGYASCEACKQERNGETVTDDVTGLTPPATGELKEYIKLSGEDV